MYADVENVTFEQYIDCLLERPEKVLYQTHTHPLTSLCAVCHMDYNIICMFLPLVICITKL